MKIVTLIENLVKTGGLYAEHGLAIYLEAGNRKILFDTGQTGAFIYNAPKLKVDIEDIDVLVLSHGHYDHCGGLYAFLEKNRKARVYAKQGLFTPKYHGQYRFIGIPEREDLLRDRLFYIDSITEIADDVYIMPEIKILNSEDTHFENLFIKQDGRFIQDQFAEELYLVAPHQGMINIITACSHRGITNIGEAATNYFDLPVNLILGGSHSQDCTPEQYRFQLDYFRRLNPKLLGVSHCTGVEKYADLKRDLGSMVFYNYTGNFIEI